MEDLRVGLIGFGTAGRYFHAPLIDAADGLELTDIVSSRRDEIQALWPRRTVYPTADAFFERADVDVVVVATPNERHVEHARQALERNWAVVVDKPFTLTAAEADELIALAGEANRLLTVYQNRRWDGDFQTVRRLIDGGKLGQVHYFESHFDRYRPEVRDRWREQDVPGGGLLYDLGPHLIDQALVLFGIPDWVHARIEKQRPGAVADDFFHLMLGYEECTVNLSAGMLVRQPRARFRIDGSIGTYIKHGLDPQEAALRAGSHPSDPGFGVENSSRYGTIATDIEGAVFEGHIETLPGNYVDFYDKLVRAINAGEPVPVRAEEAREVIRIIEVAIESNRSGQRVKLNPIIRNDG